MMMEINQSYNHTWKVTNAVIIYCDTRTDVHIHTQQKKYINNNSNINCGNDN